MSHLDEVVQLHTDLTMLILRVKQTNISDFDIKWSGIIANLESAHLALGKYFNVAQDESGQ